MTALLALVLALTISTPAFAASEDFDPQVTVTQGTNKITVALIDTESNNAILAAYKPTLSVPCDRTVTSVTAPNGSTLSFEQKDGMVSFTVAVGGTYTLTFKTTSGGGGGSSSASSNPTVNTETTTAPDGSTVKTETKKDGTVVETVKSPDGGTTVTESRSETKADGTTVETKKTTATAANGTTSTTTTVTDENGSSSESGVRVSSKAVKEAQETGGSVALPIEVSAGNGGSTSSTVSITVPAGSGNVKVEIPVSDVSSGTVIVLVHEDGTEEIVKTTLQTESGVQFTVEGNVTVKVIDNSREFSDTEGHWSQDEVNYVAARGLFEGIGDGKFGVGDETTRAMVMTVLARLAGVDTDGGTTWYDKGVAWAKENDVSDGSDPNGTLTREQLAVMLYRYSGSPAVSGELDFADADEVSDWARDAMLWATQVGILGGNGDGTVTPGGSAERAQVAAMFARFLRLAVH